MTAWNRAAAEFPAYPANTLPALPAGFEDTSWHNNASPSARRGNLELFVDWPDAADREWDTGNRFILLRADDPDCVIAETNNWDDMLAAIDNAE